MNKRAARANEESENNRLEREGCVKDKRSCTNHGVKWSGAKLKEDEGVANDVMGNVC